VIVARPAELVREPAARRVLEAIAPDERLERYRQRTGIDPRALESLVWADLDLGDAGAGTLLAIRGPFSAPLAVAEMAHRMLPVESSADEPWVRRIGHLDGERRDLVALDDHVLVAITGPPALARAILDRARGEDVSPSAVGSPVVRLLFEAHRAAPLVVVAPRPLELPSSGIGLLLAREQALAAAAVPATEEHIALTVELRGEFPPGAEENFRAFVRSLAESDLGAALGMREVLSTLRVQSDDGRVVLRASVSAPTIAAGLRLLLDAEIAELVEPPDVRPAEDADVPM
jgi:hypothetical protein